jgi:HlyD family secretion protein
VFYRLFIYALPVGMVSASTGVVDVRVKGPGTLQARVPMVLSARTTATIVSLHADQGDLVTPGQLLAVLDARELAAKRAAAASAQETVARNIRAAEANLSKAQADLELARSNHRRSQTLFGAGFISQAALDASQATLRAADAGAESSRQVLAARQSEATTTAQELQYAQAVLSHARILAPSSGIITQRVAEVGNTVMPGTPIFRMVDPATLWISARIDETVVGQVSVGQPAQIRLRTGETVPGKVARISRQSDPAAREMEVNVAFDTVPQRFAIDQEAAVTIRAGEQSGVVLPATALMQMQGRQGVLVITDGRARFIVVETGAVADGRVLISEGIAAGTQVVANPEGVQPGTRVRPAAAEG